MFDKIKSKINPDIQEAVTDTLIHTAAGISTGLVVGALLLPVTIAMVLVNKASR